MHNDDDRATELSSRSLVAPLAESVGEAAENEGWSVELEGDPSKARLSKLLGGEDTPSLLFTASHGVGLPAGDPKQRSRQGALICQNWPGPRAWQGRGPLLGEHYFAAEDLDGASPLGLVAFLFACYGGGTPRLDDFAHLALREPFEIAPKPFVAKLPQALLGHPNGGALAVIAHVDRAWGYSFDWRDTGPQLAVFESTIRRLHDDHPIGSAVEFFDERYSELSTVLADELEEVRFGKEADDVELANLWTANNDARSYVVLGDPAVRLAASEIDGPLSRPEIGVVEVSTLVEEEAPMERKLTLEEFCDRLAKTAATMKESAPAGTRVSIRAVAPLETSSKLELARDVQDVEIEVTVGEEPTAAPMHDRDSDTWGDPLAAFKASVRQETDASTGVDYFNSGEHMWLAQKGYVKACDAFGLTRDEYGRRFALLSRRAGDESFTYGELVALSGDFYGSAEDLWSEKPARFPWLWEDNDISDLREAFAEELDAIEKQQRGLKVGYPDHNIAMAWNAKAFIELALQNTAHFGWHSMVTYCKYHTEALRLAARSAGELGEAKNRTFRKALFYNAFGDHFLTDGFAAGHIRCPREQIRQWAADSQLSEKLAGALSKLLHDQDGHIASFHGPNEESRPENDGLWVKNALGHEWHTRCDGQLFLIPDAEAHWNTVVEQPVQAVQASVAELLEASRTGDIPSGTFPATKHVPFPHPDGPKLSEKFPADIGSDDLDELVDSIKWYMKVPWISAGVDRESILALFAALPGLMARFRQDVSKAVDEQPSLAERLPAEYVEAYRNVG